VSERRTRSLMLAPFVAGTVLLLLVPALVTFGLAFFSYDGLTPPTWVGFDNFSAALDDPALADSVRASLIFVALAVPVRLCAAVGLALLLHVRFRGVGAHRTVAFIPYVVPEAAWAMAWAFLLNPLYGPVNVALGGMGVPEPDWFTSSGGAMAMMVLIAAFTVGEGFVVALAARQELPGELYDLAALEGARPWHVLRRVTLPLMAPTLALLAGRDIAVSLQASFTAAYLITDGGPDRSTLFLPILVYDYAFEQLRYGYAAAISLALFALTTVLVVALVGLVRRWSFALAR
jgi:multiple sugar transport system permease protein